LASILRRDWACVALVALARNRSTKACRWARRSSCALLLCLDRLALQGLLLVALALETRVSAAPERQFGAVEMEDVVGDIVEEIAIMADDEDRRWAALQIIREPQYALEIEIVGRLVEQQQVGLGEEHRSKRHAHAPAAGIFG